MYDYELLEQLKQQEADLVFPKFDFDDAYTLGTMLREAGKQAPKPIAVRIVLDDMIIYQSFLPGTDHTNLNWMDKKRRTVERCHTSSLRAAAERALSTEVPQDWQQDEEHYAFCGGGFPIFVNGKYCGAAIVSGLPHLQDHQTLVDTIGAFLGK